MKKILTVVIPSYNTAMYIKECLPYFLDQRVLDDLELLIVDDGSTDNTPELADYLQKQYPQCIRVIHKTNGGHGSVINYGIKYAKGKYFKVVDGDDWVVTENFVRLINELKSLDADIIVNPYYEYHIKTKQMQMRSPVNSTYGKIMKIEDVVETLGIIGIHAFTIKTSILRNNKISMEENCYYEDSEYDIYPIPYLDTIISYDFPVTVYRIGSPTQSVNISNVLKNLEMHKKIISNLIAFYNSLPMEISNARKSYIEKFIISRINSQYMIYLRASISREAKKEINEFDKFLKEKSTQLYERSSTILHIRLLRTNTWICYVGMKIAFRVVRMKRGF